MQSPFPFSITSEPIAPDRDKGFLAEAPYIHQHIGERNKPNLKKVEHFFKKWKQYPEVWNWYHVSLIKNNRKAEADKLLQKTIEQFPDYLFARVNEAKQFIQSDREDKALEWAGPTPDLQRLFPEHTLFHVGEVTNYYSVYIELELKRGNIDKADDYLQLLQDLEGAEDFVEQYREKIMLHRLYQLSENLAKYKDIRPEYVQPAPPDGYSHRSFVHKEIEKLYNHIDYLEKETIDTILALPRKTAIADLEQILYRTLFEYSEEDYGTNNYFTLPHAVWFLYAFRAVESMPLASYLLLWDNETREYWYGDSFSENVWPLFFIFLEHDTAPLLEILRKPNLDAFAKGALIEAMEQIAHHYPDRRDEVIGCFNDLLQFYIDNHQNEDIIDSTMTGIIEYRALNLRAVELLPKLKTLHEIGCIDDLMCGDYENVEAEMNSNEDRTDKWELPSIYNLAEEEKRCIESINKADEEEERRKEAKALIPATLSEEKQIPKVGRNEPCPCGSGKKFKKCCGG